MVPAPGVTRSRDCLLFPLDLFTTEDPRDCGTFEECPEPGSGPCSFRFSSCPRSLLPSSNLFPVTSRTTTVGPGFSVNGWTRPLSRSLYDPLPDSGRTRGPHALPPFCHLRFPGPRELKRGDFPSLRLEGPFQGSPGREGRGGAPFPHTPYWPTPLTETDYSRGSRRSSDTGVCVDMTLSRSVSHFPLPTPHAPSDVGPGDQHPPVPGTQSKPVFLNIVSPLPSVFSLRTSPHREVLDPPPEWNTPTCHRPFFGDSDLSPRNRVEKPSSP